MRRELAESLNHHHAVHAVLAQAQDAYQHQLKYESAQRKRQLNRPA
jgi:hypothetical protein